MHYTVDGGAEKPKKGREATRRLATAGDHSLPPLGLERQRREMFFSGAQEPEIPRRS